MIPPSSGCNLDVVFIGRKTTAMAKNSFARLDYKKIPYQSTVEFFCQSLKAVGSKLQGEL